MRIIEDVKLDFQDVLIIPKRSTLDSRADVTIERTFKFKWSKADWTGIPIIAANMDHTGTFKMAEALCEHKMLTALHKFYKPDEVADFLKKYNEDFVFQSIGLDSTFIDKKAIFPMKVCIDVANGYTEKFLDFVKKIRNIYPNMIIMAGNVVTAEMTEALILAGADIVKVGIGPGSVCTTRLVAGVGYPQLSAVIECSDAAHGIGGLICSDGGCTTPGDIAKAFGAGADFVMLGGMLAGHSECSGEVVPPIQLKAGLEKELDRAFDRVKNPTQARSMHQAITVPDGTNFIIKFGNDDLFDSQWGLYPIQEVIKQLPSCCFEVDPNAKMKFYGMSSEAAMEKYSGGVAKHRAAEGKEVLIPFKGSVDGTVQQILGGVRSACTYTGSKTLKELPKRTTFVRVSRQNNKVFD